MGTRKAKYKQKFSINLKLAYAKINFILGIFALIIIFPLFSCEDEKKTEIVNASGILSEYKQVNMYERRRDLDKPLNHGIIRYMYSDDNNLSLTHFNAGFNSCPQDIYAKIEINGNIINIIEDEKSPDCNLLSLYDLQFEINNLPPKKYTVKISEPYVTISKDKIEFEIDLTEIPNGEYVVKRQHYPWGL